jgi:hypothetical protein
MIEERYCCPYCDGWENTRRHMPDSQGEFWLICDDCHKVSNLPDHTIIAELELLKSQIDSELKTLQGGCQTSELTRTATRARR